MDKDALEDIFIGIPRNYDEYISYFNLNEWPERLTSELIFSLRDELKEYGDADNIQTMLEEAILIDFLKLNEIEDRHSIYENDLMKYASEILDVTGSRVDRQNREKAKRIEAFEKLGEKVRTTSEQVTVYTFPQTDDIKTIDELNLKSVELFPCPTFSDREFTQFPGSVDVHRQILRVFRLLKVHDKFRKQWRRLFISDASIGMVLDMFWYIFLDYFRDEDSDDKEKYFSRTALHYGTFVQSIPEEMKDDILKVYPEVVSMVLYCAFYHSFPNSRRIFGPDFKQKVINTCYHWMTGIHPLPNSFNTWPTEKLESLTARTEKSSNKASVQDSKKISTIAYTFSRNLFDPKSCSPLIYKFLQLHDIDPFRSEKSKCNRRTDLQVKEVQSYEERLKSLEKCRNHMRMEFVESNNEYEQQYREIAKQRKALEARFEKFKTDLIECECTLDVRKSLLDFTEE